MTEFEISELNIPKSLDDADAADFVAASELVNQVINSIVGSNDFAMSAAERLPIAQDPDWNHVVFIAKVDGNVVARAGYASPRPEAAKECWIDIYVDERSRRLGIADALLEKLRDAARADAKTALYSRVLARYNPDSEQVAAASGFGSVSVDDTGPAFALAHGFTLEQVGLINRVALPVAADLLAERSAVARAGYGEDYELLCWSGHTPDEHVESIAMLLTAMSTEDPHAELEVSEDVWDADRVRATEERESASPRTKLTAAARDRDTGALVAFTTLDVPPELDRPVNQEATLVLPAHRGKRLGLAVKLENLRQLSEKFPGHPSVTTINAFENEYMISVNRSVGFVPVGQGGIFSRGLED